MALVNKPDESIFASSAKQGEVDNFPDLLRGWGISFEQTGGIPPMEWFNFLFKRLDEKHTYLMQRGLPEWSATQDYPAGAFVQYQGLSYKALRTNKNSPPSASNSADWQRWGFTLTEIAKASLTQQGIVQLNSATNSDNETMAATPKAVKTAYDLANGKQSPATTLAGYGIGNFKVEPFVGNLNTLKTDGVYAITQASRSQNLPVSTSCHIKVIAGGDGAWCRQLAYVAYSTDVYERHQTSYQTDSWSPWVKIDSLDKIPNSKKSSAVDSNSADTVATSAAVKIAYDKGVEAKTAADGAQRTANDGVSKATTAQNTANSAVTKADNAQRAADNANNNANNRVSKSGDTMTGILNLNLTDALLRFQRNGVNKSAIGFRNETSEDLLLYNYAFNTEFALRQHDLYCNKSLNLPGAVFENGDYAGFNIKNGSGRYVRVEGNPHSDSGMMTFVYREASGVNIHAVFLPKKDGTILLDSDISHATNGTNKAKVASEFALGELNKTKANLADFSYQKIGNFEIRKYPDGTMIQTYFIDQYDLKDWKEKSFNWAQAFVGVPMIFGGILTSANWSHFCSVNILKKSNHATCYYWEYEIASDNQGDVRIQFLAIGRWK